MVSHIQLLWYQRGTVPQISGDRRNLRFEQPWRFFDFCFSRELAWTYPLQKWNPPNNGVYWCWAVMKNKNIPLSVIRANDHGSQNVNEPILISSMVLKNWELLHSRQLFHENRFWGFWNNWNRKFLNSGSIFSPLLNPKLSEFFKAFWGGTWGGWGRGCVGVAKMGVPSTYSGTNFWT